MPQSAGDSLEVLTRLSKGAAKAMNPKRIMESQRENKQRQIAKAAARKGQTVEEYKGSSKVPKLLKKLLASKIILPAIIGITVVFFVIIAASTVISAGAAAKEKVESIVNTVTFGLVGDDDSLSDEDREQLENDESYQEYAADIEQCLEKYPTSDMGTIVADVPENTNPYIVESWIVYASSINDDDGRMTFEEYSTEYEDMVNDYLRENPDDDVPPPPEAVAEAIEPQMAYEAGSNVLNLGMFAAAEDGKLDGDQEDFIEQYRGQVIDQCGSGTEEE